MKTKIFLLFIIYSSILLNSCSGEENQNDPSTEVVLAKKIISTSSLTNSTITSDIFYSGNKIVNEIQTNGYETKYYYSGNLISSIERYQNNVIKETYLFNYNSAEKVTSCNINIVDYYQGTLNINYNSNGSISYNTAFTYPPSLDVETKSYTATIIDNEIETFTENGSNVIYTYLYDSKNNASKNIQGYDKIYLTKIERINGCYKNVIQVKKNNILNRSSIFSYNSDDYPVTENLTNFRDNGTVQSTKNNAYYY